PHIGRVAFAATQNATSELARTPLRPRVLAEAGVVDAGGRGLVVVLAALVSAITGQMPHLPVAAIVAHKDETLLAVREAGDDSYLDEVSYLLASLRTSFPLSAAADRPAATVTINTPAGGSSSSHAGCSSPPAKRQPLRREASQVVARDLLFR